VVGKFGWKRVSLAAANKDSNPWEGISKEGGGTVEYASLWRCCRETNVCRENVVGTETHHPDESKRGRGILAEKSHTAVIGAIKNDSGHIHSGALAGDCKGTPSNGKSKQGIPYWRPFSQKDNDSDTPGDSTPSQAQI